MDIENLAKVIELGLLCSQGPCSEQRLRRMFSTAEQVSAPDVRAALALLADRWQERALELVSSASGWQLRTSVAERDHVRRLLEVSPPRLSRAQAEVLAIVAYKQPVTRGGIEAVRGVSTSAAQLLALEELGWVDVLGQRETPGRPLLYGITDRFLDDLGLSSVSELPPLDEFELPTELMDAVDQDLPAEQPSDKQNQQAQKHN